MRANREGMSPVYREPSSVVQAAKAGMKTWWTALTTRSDGSARDSSISSKPWNENTRTKKSNLKANPQEYKETLFQQQKEPLRNSGAIMTDIVNTDW